MAETGSVLLAIDRHAVKASMYFDRLHPLALKKHEQHECPHEIRFLQFRSDQRCYATTVFSCVTQFWLLFQLSFIALVFTVSPLGKDGMPYFSDFFNDALFRGHD